MSFAALSRANERDARAVASLLEGSDLLGGTVVMVLDDIEQDEQDFIIEGFVEYEDGETNYPFTLIYHGVA